MKVNPLRTLARKVAMQLNAPKSVALLKDAKASYQDIMVSIANELGIEKFTAAVLKQKDPSFAFNALRFVPNLSDTNREQLTAKIGAMFTESPKPALQNNEALITAVTSVPQTVSSVNLKLIPGAAFQCYFTLFWLSPPNIHQPMAGFPNSGNWKWSDKMDIEAINNDRTYDCKYFASPECPLNEGDTVWIMVSIVCGNNYEVTNFSSKYSASGGTLEVHTWGASVNPQFGLPN
jgi:hypothetical protein